MSASPNALEAGSDVHWYRVSRVLGHGGFGITYLALDTNLDQPVAVKEYLPAAIATRGADGQVVPLTPDHAGDYAWGLDRFIAEGRTLAKFDHPAVVRVLSVFEANGTAYLVMRFERGRTLAALLKAQRTIAEADTLRVLDACAAGLEVVHAGGFIHRDIKPANIYLREGGDAVLIDFGSARLALSEHTQTLTTIVSPGYAPFEQYQSDGSQQGPWTDVYALAATAYRCVTGIAPMAAVDRGRGILEGRPDPLVPSAELAGEQCSPAFLAAIDAGLAFRIEERPRDVAAWRAALHGAAPASADAAVTQPADPEAPTEVATTVAATRPTGTPAASPESGDATAPDAGKSKPRRRWYRKKRWWLVAVLVLLILSGEETTPPPPSAGEPGESGVPAPAGGSADNATDTPAGDTDTAPPPADAPEGEAPDPPAPDDPELVRRFEQAVVNGDYAAAEGFVAEAARRGATEPQVRQARRVIAAHRALSEVVALAEANPGLLPEQRLGAALEQAGKALDDGRADRAVEIAERVRRQLLARLRKDRPARD